MLKGVGIGAGYFSRFQYEAWNRMPDVTITALCNRDKAKAESIAAEFNIGSLYASVDDMLDREQPDFVDIITPPETHLAYCRAAIDRGIAIICQKPLAPTMEDAQEIVRYAEKKKVPFMVHENFRFQPWYREIKKLVQQQAIGHTLFSVSFRMRAGDGWGEDAYLDRQPYFRDMPRLLIYETGIHFIDTFRYLLGEMHAVYARLRRLNPVIQGEDCGIVHFEFKDGAQGIWDANRYNESNCENPRYTFGEMLIEGNGGSIRLYMDGTITIQALGAKERVHRYRHENRNFAGDCVYATQQHFIQGLMNGRVFETNGHDYLRNIAVQEAIYTSNQTGQLVVVDYGFDT